jgi:ABC-2 type transport system ATP-binding protein
VSRVIEPYGDFQAVEDLSLRVEQGELYALLGTNGAGKTSALEVIEGHRKASSGTVRVAGPDARLGRRGDRARSASVPLGTPPLTPPAGLQVAARSTTRDGNVDQPLSYSIAVRRGG